MFAQERGGSVKSGEIAAVSWGSGRLDIFARGTAGDLLHMAWTGSAWDPPVGQPWETLGGEFSSPPEVVSSAAGTLDVFGLGPGRQMYHKAWTAGGWDPAFSN